MENEHRLSEDERPLPEPANPVQEYVNPLPEDEELPESEELLTEEYDSVFEVMLTDDDEMLEVIQEVSEEEEEDELPEHDQPILAAMQDDVEEPHTPAIEHEIIRHKADLDGQHTAYAALQESSNILKQQVDGYDRLAVTLKNRESSLETKVNELEKDLAAVLTGASYNSSRPERHSFSHFSCMAARKCRWCWQQIRLLRGAVKCQYCGIIVHKVCQAAVSQSCGVLEDLWTHYTSVNRDLKPGTIPVLDVHNIACSVYLHLFSPEQRQLRYMTFKHKTVQLYIDVPRENTRPEEFYPLGLHNIYNNLVTDVSGRFNGPNGDKFVAIHYYQNRQAGIPITSFMLEFLTLWDREMFIDAYNSQKSR